MTDAQIELYAAARVAIHPSIRLRSWSVAPDVVVLHGKLPSGETAMARFVPLHPDAISQQPAIAHTIDCLLAELVRVFREAHLRNYRSVLLPPVPVDPDLAFAREMLR